MAHHDGGAQDRDRDAGLAEQPLDLASAAQVLGKVIPFVTETLWKVLTGGESLVIASWPVASGVPADADALRRVEDMLQASGATSPGLRSTRFRPPGPPKRADSRRRWRPRGATRTRWN